MGLAEALFWSQLVALASPTVFLPAIAVGGLARTRWLAVLGGLAIAAVGMVIALMRPLPEGASHVWVAMPLIAVPPLVWTLAIFHLRRWLRGRQVATPGDPLARTVWSLIGLIAGACIGGVAGLAVGMAYVDLAKVSSFEGLAGYTVMFLFVLPGILVGMIAGAVIGWRKSRARTAQ